MTKTKTVEVYPPEQYTTNTNEPAIKGNKTSDLVMYAINQKAAIQSCNADKKAIREWGNKDD